jgi:hypothetical protein
MSDPEARKIAENAASQLQRLSRLIQEAKVSLPYTTNFFSSIYFT